ncbi:MAG: hypothetical protein AAF662_13795 [Pseudomonadota bacterium]
MRPRAINLLLCFATFMLGSVAIAQSERVTLTPELRINCLDAGIPDDRLCVAFLEAALDIRYEEFEAAAGLGFQYKNRELLDPKTVEDVRERLDQEMQQRPGLVPRFNWSEAMLRVQEYEQTQRNSLAW